MKNTEFSKQEKFLINQYLLQPPKKWENLVNSAVYVVPSTIFALYGFLKEDFVAVFIGWLALSVYVIWYLMEMEKNAGIFYFILTKYEAKIKNHKG